MQNNSIPYGRLSGFYWIYFASLGVIAPYWGLYLEGIGFDAKSIGELMAILMVTKIVAPYLWSWVADHTGQCMKIIRIASVCSAIAFVGVFLNSSFWWLALVMLVFSFFWNATLPQFEVNTINHLGKQTHKYSVVRLWGSLGFVFSVVAIGWVLDKYGYQVIPVSVFIIYILTAGFSFFVSDAPRKQHKNDQGSMLSVLKQPHVSAILLICFLMQASHGPYYTFYSIYLKQLNYSSFSIGWLWAAGVMSEVVLFLFMHKIMPKNSLRLLLMAALILTSLRWVLIGYYAQTLWLVIFAQCLHAASFGLFHSVAIELFHRNFKGRLQGRGQALYSAVSFGGGGMAGALVSGAYWDSVSPQVVFLVAGAVSFLAFLMVLKLSRYEPEKCEPEKHEPEKIVSG